jgi:hypothetical protein
VLAAGAADRHLGEPLALPEVAVGHAGDELHPAVDELRRPLLLEHVVGHLGVEAGARPQLGDPVRVGQEPHVGHEVGVDGDAVLEAEADHAHLEPHRERSAELGRDAGGELVDVEVGGVDHEVGVAPQPGEHLALALQAVEQPAVALERARAPGCLLAADEHLVARLEEDQRRVAAGRAVREVLRQRVEEGARAHVDHERHGLSRPLAGVDEADDVLEQAGRQVVDHEVAEILQLLGRRAAAGPGHPGHDDQLAGSRLGHVSPPRCSVSHRT